MAQEERKQDELHTASVIVSARQIEADVRPIIDTAIVSPGYPIRAGKMATALFVVIIEKISQQSRPLGVWDGVLSGLLCTGDGRRWQERRRGQRELGGNGVQKEE
jgi:hypothetical protein